MRKADASGEPTTCALWTRVMQVGYAAGVLCRYPHALKMDGVDKGSTPPCLEDGWCGRRVDTPVPSRWMVWIGGRHVCAQGMDDASGELVAVSCFDGGPRPPHPPSSAAPAPPACQPPRAVPSASSAHAPGPASAPPPAAPPPPHCPQCRCPPTLLVHCCCGCQGPCHRRACRPRPAACLPCHPSLHTARARKECEGNCAPVIVLCTRACVHVRLGMWA